MTLGEPNTRLRSVRHAMRMSQAELAKAVREAGSRAGEPNTCSAKAIQRWESGVAPRGNYLRALEMVTGQTAENLGFASDRYGVDTDALSMAGEGTWLPEAESQPGASPLNGIWVSRYEYPSSSRGATFSSAHYVMVIQHGARLQVRSLPGTATGRVMMDLTVNGQALTGTWTEETSPAGFYQGSVYHGAIQMLLDPTGHRMTGQWAGFGRDYEVNTGPWSLELVTHDTRPEAQEKYNRPVEGDPEQDPESP